MEQLTASNIMQIMQKGYQNLPPHQENGIEMGVYAFNIYKLSLSAQSSPNLSLPINYFGTIIEVNEELSLETINFYLKKK